MKTAVIYWSGTGNTEQMASAIAEGAGAELFTISEFSGDIAAYDRIAFGCPAMGDEVLEESDFEPFFSDVEGTLLMMIWNCANRLVQSLRNKITYKKAEF